jgi:hypothetical protein
MDPGSTEWKLVLLNQLHRCRKPSLVKQKNHLCGSNIGHPMSKVMLPHKRFSFIENCSCAVHISPGQFQTGE